MFPCFLIRMLGSSGFLVFSKGFFLGGENEIHEPHSLNKHRSHTHTHKC